jgi:hypothetical protein
MPIRSCLGASSLKKLQKSSCLFRKRSAKIAIHMPLQKKRIFRPNLAWNAGSTYSRVNGPYARLAQEAGIKRMLAITRIVESLLARTVGIIGCGNLLATYLCDVAPPMVSR